MSKQVVPVCAANDPNSDEVFRTLQNALDRIRTHAYALFEARGSWPDASLDDWFQAERDLFQIPGGDLSETGTGFALKVDAQGFAADQLNVAVDPHSITVQGNSELGGKELFGRFEVGACMDSERVTASFEDGVLTVVAPKADTVAPASEPAPKERALAHSA